MAPVDSVSVAVLDGVLVLEALAKGRIWRYPVSCRCSCFRSIGLETAAEGS